MNHVTKKILTVFMSMVMFLSVALVPVNATEAGIVGNTVTVTVERTTIGQGFLVRPVTVKVKSGDTVAKVFEKVMSLKRITYPSTAGDYGFYLESINNADTGIVNIPKEISAMPDVAMWDGSVVKAPTNEVNDGNSYENGGLGTASYNTMSGWMFTVNNVDTGAAADSIEVKPGDVIRWQFSLYGYGADIGFDTESYTGIPEVTLANKDELIREAAVVSENAEMMKDAGVKTAYENAVTLLEEYNAAQDRVDTALITLQKAKKDYINSLQQSEPKIKVARAAIKSVKNVKRYKAKIRVKKLSGVTGYQYKYATNKKFKKATVKTTKKTSLTTKKFKKKQRCYVQVRAYKKVKGIRHYGKWSKKKSVKIKK